jgi:hypothetical protein
MNFSNKRINYGIKFLISILFSTFFISSYGQKNFMSGYIISDGDQKKEGFIDYQYWDKNPRVIKFKTSTSSEIVEYTAKNIQQFFVNGKLYVSAEVIIDESPRKTEDLDFFVKNDTIRDIVFLKTIFEGDKSLYYYKSETEIEHFYIKSNNIYEELRIKRYKKNGKFSINTVTEKPYIGQLKIYFPDCPDIRKQIENSELTLSDLKKLFKKYYFCIDDKIDFTSSNDKLKTEFGVNIGCSATDIQFKGQIFDYLTEVDFPTSFNVAGGVFFGLSVPGFRNKLFFNNEIEYSGVKSEGVLAIDKYGIEDYSITTTSFNYQYLRLNTSLKYRIPVDPFTMTISIGFLNGYAFKSYNHLKKTYKLYPDLGNEDLALAESKKFERGISGSLGLEYDHYFMELRAEKTDGMSVFSGLGSNIYRYFVMIGYKF